MKLLITLAAAAGIACSQVFEVATVKSSPPPTGPTVNITLDFFQNNKLMFENATLSDCLKFAYNIVSDVQLMGPDWIKSREVLFDIVALAPAGTTRDESRRMLQPLLAERLKVSIHHEQRDLPYVALTVGKNGSKMPRSKFTTPGAGRNNAAPGHLHGTQASMDLITMLLSRFEGRTIVDRTGLTGDFEINLDWGVGPVAQDSTLPALSTAMEEQLGLRLESRKGPLDVIVVDHAEKVPVEN